MARVLLIEPDRQLARRVCDYFRRSDHKIRAFADPQKAIMAADKQPPDIVITEMMLAGRTGAEFLYELRSYPEWQSIPVIVAGRLSAEEIIPYQKTFGQLNVTAYVYKPAMSLAGLMAEANKILQVQAA